MPSFTVTPELLASIAGVILSLFFSYIPGLNTKFAALDTMYQRLVMLLLLVITAGALYGLGCAAIILAGITCDKQGLLQLIWIFILAVIANQSAFSISPPTKAVKAVKAAKPS